MAVVELLDRGVDHVAEPLDAVFVGAGEGDDAVHRLQQVTRQRLAFGFDLPAGQSFAEPAEQLVQGRLDPHPAQLVERCLELGGVLGLDRGLGHHVLDELPGLLVVALGLRARLQLLQPVHHHRHARAGRLGRGSLLGGLLRLLSLEVALDRLLFLFASHLAVEQAHRGGERGLGLADPAQPQSEIGLLVVRAELRHQPRQLGEIAVHRLRIDQVELGEGVDLLDRVVQVAGDAGARR